MNGAEALVQTAVQAGVEVCFANAGTTELPLVAALDTVPGIRAVLGLFEGVCTGAADGYGRMAGKPALTLLHHGPGLANGIANLHNARRARTPLVNLIGEHVTWHVAVDSPLTTDIAALAAPVSSFVRTTRSPRELPSDFADAIACSRAGGVASLIIPMDCLSGEAPGAAEPSPIVPLAGPSSAAVACAAQILRSGKPAAMLLGSHALGRRGLLAAARISAAAGCFLLCETFPARLERGSGLPAVEKLPYFPEQAIERLSSFACLILAGAREPVAFFGYPGIPSRLTPRGTEQIVLAQPEEDAIAALESLADELGPRACGDVTPSARPERPHGPLSPRSLGETIAALQPEGLILVDEAATSAFPYFPLSADAPPFTYLNITGGAIGQGLPCAAGAALACPDRRVLAFQADGSGMYTVQALWTMAREALDVTVVVCSNRSYHILQQEMGRAGVMEAGPQARGLTELSRPELDWVALGRGMGIPGVRVVTADALVLQLERALAEPGPYLIEAVL
jgi:acetolactate synthase-1/2/3 large subunit